MTNNLALAHKKPHRARTAKHVQITADDGSVDQDSVTISIGAGDEVVWSAGRRKAIVVFASPGGSPFHDSIFHVPASGSVSSGVAREGTEDQEFKYTVIGGSGVNDPIVIIQK